MIVKSLVNVFLLLLILLCVPMPSGADSNEAYFLYQQVLADQKKLEDLSPEQQERVVVIHSILKEHVCDGCTKECREAKEQAKSYRDDLEEYVNSLHWCVVGNDFTNDCSWEFKRVGSAHSHFESVVSDVSSFCE